MRGEKNEGKKCFQPTYEELKLCVLVCACMRLYGFQPTYEELKPGMRATW